MIDRLILAFRKDDWVSLGLAKIMVDGYGSIKVPPIYDYLDCRAQQENVGAGYIYLYLPCDVEWPKLDMLLTRAIKVIEFSMEEDPNKTWSELRLPIKDDMDYVAPEWSSLPYIYLKIKDKQDFIFMRGLAPQEAIFVGEVLHDFVVALKSIIDSIDRLQFDKYTVDPTFTPEQIIVDFIFNSLNTLLANYKQLAVRSAIVELFKNYSLEEYVPLQSLIEFSYNRLQAFNYSANLLKLLEKENINYGDL